MDYFCPLPSRTLPVTKPMAFAFEFFKDAKVWKKEKRQVAKALPDGGTLIVTRIMKAVFAKK